MGYVAMRPVTLDPPAQRHPRIPVIDMALGPIQRYDHTNSTRRTVSADTHSTLAAILVLDYGYSGVQA